MAYRNEANEVQSLINLYRANPNMFDDSHLDVLQQKADKYNINFKPIKDTTTLTSLAKNFTGGFVRGMVPFVPPDEQPRTTYEAIAQSLGHLAGFAPSILSLPLRGATTVLKSVAGLAKTAEKVEKAGKVGIGFLDQWSFPMMGSRLAKGGLEKGITKLELDTLDYMKAGGVGRAISEEAIGLGAASVVSDIWSGPDNYMNTFIGGALAGGVFGGIGNWRAIGNRLKLAKSEGQRTRAEDAIKAAVGSTFQGLPTTLRGEPIEMQLYEYLLGGFFGYKSRPAAEAAGGQFVMKMDATKPENIFKPENNTGFSDLNTQTQSYVKKKSTAQAEMWLDKNFDGNLNSIIKERLRFENDSFSKEAYDKEIRNFAHEQYTKKRENFVTEEYVNKPEVDNTIDYMDDSNPSASISVHKVARNVHKTIDPKTVPYENVVKDIKRTIEEFTIENDGTVKKTPDPDAFVQRFKDNPIYSEYLKNDNNVRNFYKLFTQQNKQQYEVLVFNDGDKTVSTVQPFTNAVGKFIGVSQYNSPIVDIFGAGRGFGFLSYVTKPTKKGVVYEDIFKWNPIKNEFNIKDTTPLVKELHKQNKYIYAGIKDKNSLLTAELIDNGRTIQQLAEFASKPKELLDYYNQSESKFIRRYKVKNAKEIHQRQFVSNILHELINHGYQRGGQADLRALDKIIDQKYFKDAIDFNKRMQGYVEASGMPMNPNTFKNSIGSKDLRFMILNDKDFTPDSTGIISETDGGLFFRPAVFKDIVRVMGFNAKTQDNVKPVVMGRLNGEDAGTSFDKGLVFLKSSGKNAEGQPAINKLIKDNNLDFVVFDSANKIKGNTEPTSFRYENGNYVLEGNANIQKVAIESLRINPSTYEDVYRGTKGINIPRQFFITLNDKQSPKTLQNFIDHYYKDLQGTRETKKLIEDFNKTNDIKPIEEYLNKDFNNLDKMPLSFIIKQLGKSTSDSNVFRRALQKVDGLNDKQLESFNFDGSKSHSFFQDSVSNLSGLAGGKYAPYTFFEKISGDYLNSIRKYTIKRITTPFWQYGGKGWLNPVTKDVFDGADMINKRPVRGGEVLLDAGHKRMPVKIDLTAEQVKDLNSLKRGINQDGETTLGHLWNLYKISQQSGTPEQFNKLQLLGKNKVKELSTKLDNALDLLIIRVPADSLSGIRAVKFKGFTQHKGAGITTNKLEDRYLGGADKDADSAFIIQGGERNHIREVKKLRNERKEYKEEEIMSRFSTSEKLPVYSKFSPIDRLRAYQTGRQGADQRGGVIATRDSLFELYSRALNNKGVVDLGQGIKLKLKKDGFKKFVENVYGSINVNNDSTKYVKINNSNEIKNRLFNDLFIIEKNGAKVKLEAMLRNPNFKSNQAFFSMFKTNPFNQKYKKYQNLIDMSDKYSNQEFFGAAGRQFKKALNEDIFTDIRNLESAKDININLKKSIESFTPSKQEQTFLKDFLGIAELPINRLQSSNDILSDIGTNLTKTASYELLVDKGLNVYRGFSENKRNNIPDIKKVLTQTYNKARELSRYTFEATKDADTNKSFSIEDLGMRINSDKKKLIKFANQNRLKPEAKSALLNFYEIALLNPYNPKGANFSRTHNQMFGSEKISDYSKKQLMDKMQEIYDKVPEQIDTKMPKEFLQPITADSRKLVLDMDKMVSNTNKIGKTIKGNKFKVEDLDVIAIKDTDYKDLKILRDHLKNNPQVDSLNEFFIDFTARQGRAKDLSLIDMNDVRALNDYFSYGEKGAKGRFKYVNWLIDPRTISEKELQKTIQKYEGYITNVDTAKGLVKKQVSRYMSPLEAMREYFRSATRLQNADSSKISEQNRKILDFDKYGLDINDKQYIFEHISKIRNPEQANISNAAKKFLTKNIKGRTGEQLVEEYNKKFTTLMNEIGKYIYTYDKSGKRIEFKKEIDSLLKFDKAIKLNDNIRFTKDGKFDKKLFEDTVLKPVVIAKKANVVGIESVLRYQYETLLESNIKSKTAAARIAYRQKNKFEDFAFNFIDQSKYFPRTNYGYNEAAQRKMNASIDKLVKEGKDKYELLFQYKENTNNNSARVEDNFLNIAYELSGKNYKDVGYKNKPRNLLQRGQEFIDGYDIRPEVVDTYRSQVVRSYYNNLIATYGNNRIQDFKNNNTALNTSNAKQLAALKKAGYKDNTDVWSDFLYIYMKNGLGHPSLLTNRIIKSMKKGDPLQLKNNPYYLTSDYAMTSALEKLYQTGKFNKMPYLRNAPEDPKARRDYLVRRLHDLGTMEAKYNLLTLLANTGSMMTNLYGGATMTIGSAGMKHLIDSKSNKVIIDRLLTNAKGEFTLKFKNGNPVKTRKDLLTWIGEKGVIDAYIQNEFDYNSDLKTNISQLGKNSKNFIKDLKASTKRGDRDESILQLTERYGMKEKMLRAGGFFMSFSERQNRIDAFLAHALKAKERLGSRGLHTDLNDPFIFDAGLRGIEATQFLYHNSFRPAFMSTSTGKVLSRFKLFAFQSVRTRKEFYRQAKAYGFKEGTDQYKRFKDLFLTDLFSAALGGAFMYSLFDVATPPPWDWMQDLSDLLFGDKKERDRAFYGTLPRSIAPLQIVLPPIARFPQTFVELLQGDWEKFSDYTVHTMYPGGRLIYAAKKTKERPERFMHNFFRLPTDKIAYRIKREQIREARQERIEDFLDE